MTSLGLGLCQARGGVSITFVDVLKYAIQLLLQGIVQQMVDTFT